MKFTPLIYLFVLFLAISCSSKEPDRTALIERQLSIQLPKHFETILNEYETLEYIPSEYQISVVLAFDQSGLNKLEEQIKNAPYFDQLAKYRNSGNGLILDGQQAIDNYNNLMDELSQMNHSGSWITSPKGYVYVDLLGPKRGEPIRAAINRQDRTLIFHYMNI